MIMPNIKYKSCAPTMSIYITFTTKKEKKNVKIRNLFILSTVIWN